MNESLSTGFYIFSLAIYRRPVLWELFSQTLKHLFEVPPLSRSETAGPVMRQSSKGRRIQLDVGQPMSCPQREVRGRPRVIVRSVRSVADFSPDSSLWVVKLVSVFLGGAARRSPPLATSGSVEEDTASLVVSLESSPVYVG
jgi:hypothetical protein